MSSGSTYPWKRYWVPQGESPAMSDGYFVEPSADELLWLGRRSNGVPLSSLKDVPCLILLGDVGMGKTTVTRQEAEGLCTQLAGQKHEVLRLDLKRFTERQIERQVFGDPKVDGWSRGEHPLTLFLDSLDECWRRIDELESILLGEFEGRLQGTKAPLFLRLTCRSAEWRGDAGKALERLFPCQPNEEGQMRVYTLAPLSKNNILQAAASSGLDGVELLTCISDKDAQALASHPITFEMLFKIYIQGGEFPASRVELYESGCRQLCTEPHSEFGSTHQRCTTAPQRLAVASRLAALSVLTNRYLINGDAERPLGRPDVLEAAQVYGVFKELAQGEHVEVNRATTTDALQTALFSERVEGIQTWRHQSYAEFLAARYLAQRGVPINQVVTLLTDTTDNSHRLIPQLEETACWLADMTSAVFDALAPSNAEVLIRCDPGSLSAERRAMLVERYLDLVRRHEAPEVDWQLKHRFARLSHPRIAEQLGQLIVNRKEHVLVRETAIEIAAFCRSATLAAELIEVFLGRNDVLRLRTRAGFALQQIGNSQIQATLKEKATAESLDDPSDELKGLYLRILWPSHLSLPELLTLLTLPKRRNLTGAYRGFFEYELPKSLPDSDLPAVLDWLREEKVNFDILAPFGYFPTKVTSRAYEQLEDPKTRDSFVRLLRSQGNGLHNFFRDPLSKTTPQVKARQSFWVAVIEADLEPRALVSHGHLHQSGLLDPADLSFFLRRYQQTANEKHREGWRNLAFCVFTIKDQTALEQLSELANTDKPIADDLIACTSRPLVPDKQNWLKQNFEQQKEAEAARAAHPEPTLTKMIESAVTDFEQGMVPAMWTLVEYLQCDPAAPHNRNLFPRLAEGKAWKALPAELRSRVAAAIPQYLQAQEIGDLDVWNQDASYRPCIAVNPLLSLLYDESKESLADLDPRLWKKWIHIFIAYHGWHNGEHEEAYSFILATAFQNAKAESVAALERYLDIHINDDHKRSLIWRLETVWCPEIKSLVLRTLRRKTPKPTAAQDLLQVLHSQEPIVALRELEAIFRDRHNPDACSVHVPVAGALLFRNYPEEWGPRLVRSFEEEVDIGKAIVWHLFRRAGQLPEWLSRLPSSTTAELWDWLETHFPGNPYEDDEREEEGQELQARSIGPKHEMYHFRRAVLGSLEKQGTREACAAMANLMRKRPQDFWLGDMLADMRKAARRSIWKKPDPKTLMDTFSDCEKRLIRTPGDLHSLLVESIGRFEATLHAAQPSLELWNDPKEGTKTIWSPKDENNLSTRLKFHFERDLDRRGIIASREVMIRRRLGEDPAQLVDVLVTAIPFLDDGKPGDPVTVVVEVKCAWNRGVLEDMEGQLYARYLGNNELDFGIYVVAYFTCRSWNRKDDPRRSDRASKMAIEDLRARLLSQAEALSSCEKRIEALVIDARLGRGNP